MREVSPRLGEPTVRVSHGTREVSSQALQVSEEITELFAGEQLLQTLGHDGDFLPDQRRDVAGANPMNHTRRVAQADAVRPLSEQGPG